MTPRFGTLASLASMFVFAACPGTWGNANPLRINASTGMEVVSGLYQFRARISQGDTALGAGYSVDVRYSWQMPRGFAGDSPTNVISATRSGSDPQVWTARTADDRFEHGRVILQEWSVVGPSGNEARRSPRGEAFQVGCPGGAEPDLIAAQRAELLRYGGIRSWSDVGAAGYTTLPHHFVQLQGVGVIVANPTGSSLAPRLDGPLLLFFDAFGATGGDPSRYQGELSLVGWGYGTIAGPPTARPRMGRIPPHEWLEHMPGWHLNDGDFIEQGSDRQPRGADINGWHPNGWAPRPWASMSLRRGSRTSRWSSTETLGCSPEQESPSGPLVTGLALGLPHRAYLRRAASRLPVLRCFDEHHRLRHRSRSRSLHSVLSRSPHPTPSTVSRSGATPGPVRVRSDRRIRPHRSGTHSGIRIRSVPTRL